MKFIQTILLLLFPLSTFSQTWQKTYGNSGQNWGYAMLETYDKGYAILGSNEGQFGQSRLIKTDINGSVLWEKTIGFTSEAVPRAMEKTADGGLLIAGLEGKYHPSYTAFVMKINSCGETEWISIVGSPDFFDFPLKVTETRDGGIAVLVNDFSQPPLNSNSVLLIKLDNQGKELWRKNYLTQYRGPTPLSLIET